MDSMNAACRGPDGDRPEVSETQHSRQMERHAASLDELALLRETNIIGDVGRGIRGVFPVSPSEWRKGVREGRYPRPAAKVGNMTFWRATDIAALLARIAQQQEPAR